MTERTKFAVIDCEDAPKWAGHESIWVAAYGRPGEHWEHFRAFAGELPEESELDTYRGFCITGSHHDAYDETRVWIKELCEFLRVAVRRGGVKILGGCFGCQVLALALGGSVGRNPSGHFFIGPERLELTRALAQRRDFALARAVCPMVETKPEARYRGPGLHVLSSHGDCVLRLPEGADLLAQSPSAAVELWAMGRDVLAQQCHPECSAAQMEQLIIPALVASSKLPAADAASTYAAMKRPLDNLLLLAMGRFFLHGDEGEETAETISAAAAAAAAVPLGSAVAGDDPSAGADGGASSAAPPHGQGTQSMPASPAEAAAASSSASAELLFTAGAAALRGELALHDGEYELLAELNTAAAGHYGNMADLAAGLGVFASALNAKDASFTPFLGVMDAIEGQVCELETVVSTLDGYTRRLEARLKALQDRS